MKPKRFDLAISSRGPEHEKTIRRYWQNQKPAVIDADEICFVEALS
jgi:hypothetical protein